MKKLFLVIISAALLLPISCTTQETLTVISYNIRNGQAKDGDNCWDNRKPASLAMLEDQNPVVFGVQEAYDYQIAYLEEGAPKYKCVGVGREDGEHKGEHMSIFYDTTRVALLDWGTYWLSETPNEPSKGWDAACKRTATWTKMQIKKSGKEFFYVNTHLDHRGDMARKNGLALVVDSIAVMNPNKIPMIFTGDFNVLPDSENLVDLNKVMLSARNTAIDGDTMGSFNGWGKYGESSAAPSLDGEPIKELLIIDYIYYSGFSKCLKFKVLNKKYLDIPYISDHYPVMAELQF